MSETSDRERELEILGRLKEHLAERFAAVDEYVASREE